MKNFDYFLFLDWASASLSGSLWESVRFHMGHKLRLKKMICLERQLGVRSLVGLFLGLGQRLIHSSFRLGS